MQPEGSSDLIQESMQVKQTLPVEIPGGRQPTHEPQYRTCSQENVHLGSSVVDINGRKFDLGRELGRGNFGVVREAREHGSASGDLLVAVKKMKPKHSVTVAAAVLECELLRLLTETLEPCSEVSRRVPQYIAHSFVQEPEPVVFLAMTRVRGVALDFWLYGSAAERLPTIAVEDLFKGPLPGGRLASYRLATASDLTRELFLQLGEALVVISRVAYHRDVSAHNIIFDINNGRPEFTIIDFGLAVKSKSWREEWRSANLAGDPRYWSPASWMHFAYGCGYLEKHPDDSFCRQYEERLDHFSLGILGLEMLFCLWHGPDGDTDCGRSLAEVRTAWHRYWAGAYALFQRFHNGVGGLRQEMVRSRCLLILLEDYRSLCSALHSAAIAGATLAQSSAAAAAPVLLVATELVDSHGNLSWDELPTLRPSGVLQWGSSELGDVQLQPTRQ